MNLRLRPATSLKSRRIRASAVQAPQFTIDLSGPSAPARSANIGPAEVIDLSLDSPPSFALSIPEPLTNDPRSPGSFTAVVHPHIEVDIRRVPDAPGRAKSPTWSKPPVVHPQTLARTQSPDIKFRPMEVDDTDQKPLSLLFGNLAVSDSSASRPRGSSLGPAWMRERCETSSYMLMLDRYLENQKISKPLSKRKPAKTRFAANSREPLVILPFPKHSLQV